MPIEIDIAHVARLARLDLSQEELEGYKAQLGAILDHAAKVQSLQGDPVVEASHPLRFENAFREDVVRPSLDHDEVLAQAPEAIGGFFARGKLKFEVTPKSRGEVPVRSYLPQLILLGLLGGSVVFGTLAYAFGWVAYTVPGWGSGAFWFNFLWCAYNMYFAWYVVRLSLAYRQQRVDERFRALMAVEGEVLDPENPDVSTTLVALTTDLTPEGLGFRTTRYLDRGARVRFTLPLESHPVLVEGRVAHREEVSIGQNRFYEYGARLEPLEPADRDAIDLHCTQHAVPLHRTFFRDSRRPLEALRRLLTEQRTRERYTVRVPVHVSYPVNGGPRPDGKSPPGNGAPANGAAPVEQLGYLEELSRDGARLIVSHPPSPGGQVRFRTSGNGACEEGRAVAVHAMHTPMGVVFSVGIRRDRDNGREAWYRRFTRDHFAGGRPQHVKG